MARLELTPRGLSSRSLQFASLPPRIGERIEGILILLLMLVEIDLKRDLLAEFLSPGLPAAGDMGNTGGAALEIPSTRVGTAPKHSG